MHSTPTRARTRQTLARHTRFRQPHPLAQIGRAVGIALAVVLVSVLSVGSFAAWDLSRNLQHRLGRAAERRAAAAGDRRVRGRLQPAAGGTDKCDPSWAGAFGERCSGADAEGERNDVTMLVHVSEAPRRATVVSFPRDMIVPIPACPRADGTGKHSAMSAQPLNVTLMYGGLPCTVATVEEFTGMPIEFAATIDWMGVINLSNAVGGVEVCVEDPIRDRDSGLDIPAGTQELSGEQALAFLRTRYAIGDGSDLGRISNQQQFMSSLVRKLSSDEVLTDPAALFRLAYAATDAVTPSQSLASPTRMVQLALTLKDIDFDDIVFVQYPTGYDTQNPNKVLPKRAAGDALFAALAAGSAIDLTGGTSAGKSTVELPAEGEAPAAPETPAPSGPGVDASAAPDRVQLPSDITGQTAGQRTCTVGR